MVEMFYEDDWKDTYGIDIDSLEQQITGVSSYDASGTMSSADQKKILDQLPTNLSEKRRKIIETALSAVGKIPYHFGDSASYPGLEKNHFGTKAAPDEKKRSRKGLDCSHFVDWVYWTAVGNNLGNGSTETLKAKGYITRYNGVITEVEEWGKKKLAYEIQKMHEGFYYFIQFEADAQCPAEVERHVRIMDNVLRYLVVRKDA